VVQIDCVKMYSIREKVCHIKTDKILFESELVYCFDTYFVKVELILKYRKGLNYG
jgi:hypothetical protein